MVETCPLTFEVRFIVVPNAKDEYVVDVAFASEPVVFMMEKIGIPGDKIGMEVVVFAGEAPGMEVVSVENTVEVLRMVVGRVIVVFSVSGTTTVDMTTMVVLQCSVMVTTLTDAG